METWTKEDRARSLDDLADRFQKSYEKNVRRKAEFVGYAAMKRQQAAQAPDPSEERSLLLVQAQGLTEAAEYWGRRAAWSLDTAQGFRQKAKRYREKHGL